VADSMEPYVARTIPFCRSCGLIHEGDEYVEIKYLEKGKAGGWVMGGRGRSHCPYCGASFSMGNWEPPLAAQLRAWARGIYPDEAGAELLIGHAVFLDRADFTSRFISIPGDGAGLAVIDWPAAIAALNDSLPCSGGENRMLRLAASLADGIPVNLRDTLTGIDDHGIQLVTNAVRHASGHRPPSGFNDHF
jgi:hypothetical protein